MSAIERLQFGSPRVRLSSPTKKATLLAIYKREGDQVIIRWSSKWNLRRPANFIGMSKIDSITLIRE